MTETPPEDSKNRSPEAAPAIARWLALVALVFVVLAIGFGWLARSTTIASPFADPETTESSGASEEPLAPPDFRLASLDGGLIGPSDFAGEVVLIEFWATWCGPCRLQARFFEELHTELNGKGVHFLAIDAGEDEAKVREFVNETPFPYPVLLDPEDTLSRRYNIYGLPTVMIVDRQGKISYFETGLSDTHTLRKALAAAGADISPNPSEPVQG